MDALAFLVLVIAWLFARPLRAALWQGLMIAFGVPAEQRREVLVEKARSNGK